MKKIYLTGKYANNRFAMVDDEDYEFLSKWKWFFHPSGYAIRSKFIEKCGEKEKNKTVFMHKEIKNSLALIIDHIDGDKLNNVKNNLRLASYAQNRANSRINKNNSSGIRGIMWDKRLRRWKSQIGSGENRKFLGVFCNKEDAAKAYDNEAFLRYGVFSRKKG